MSTEGGPAEAVEATGETVGEAKWSALRELERRYPGLEKESIRFQVLSEGERGLLGVGYTPARVIATLDVLPAARVGLAPPADEEPGSPAGRLRVFLERVCAALDLPADVTISESDEELVAALTGTDLGIAIGKRGQTLDAIQYLANAVVFRGGEENPDRKPIVVDAAGYRARRQASLERVAERAARDAIRAERPVELEPMSAIERKIVHVFLKELGGVETASEGTEPNRRVVVLPLGGEPTT